MVRRNDEETSRTPEEEGADARVTKVAAKVAAKEEDPGEKGEKDGEEGTGEGMGEGRGRWWEGRVVQ